MDGLIKKEEGVITRDQILILEEKCVISGPKIKGEVMVMTMSSNRRRCSPQMIRTQMQGKHFSFSSKLTTDLPLYESPQAPFDQYINDRQRVFEAIFPDKRGSERLNDEEWRIQMLPIDIFFLRVNPTVDMRLSCKSQGTEYPAGVPKSVNRVLALQATRWELQGLDYVMKPSDFVLGINGALYSEKQGVYTLLKWQLELNISFVLPLDLEFVPKEVLNSVAESVLSRLLVNMKQKVNENLIMDFRRYSRERIALAGEKQREGMRPTLVPPATAPATTTKRVSGAQD